MFLIYFWKLYICEQNLNYYEICLSLDNWVPLEDVKPTQKTNKGIYRRPGEMLRSAGDLMTS